MTEPLLRVSGLSCGYHEEPVLEGIDAEIAKGDLVGIIGPNGSGKTTLLRAITRTLKPWQGTISLDGADIWHLRRKEMARQVAVVSQVAEAMMMTVREYVLLGRFPYWSGFQLLESKADQRIADKYMELTDTMHLADCRMDETSGGERQLAQIARALTQEPSILVLDEPTAHLDIAHQVRILDLIKRLNVELELTVVMVLHDLNLASEYCDHLLLLNDKHVHSTGAPAEVLTYQAVEEVYKTTVVVREHPMSKRPFVMLVTGEEMKAGKKG